MRILKVIHAWQPEGRGGTEAHAAQAAQALSARGHQVGVFARTGRPDRPEYEVTTEWQGNVGVTRVNNTFQDAWSFPWMYKNERIHEAFERELDEFKPDLVHIHHLTSLSTTLIESVKQRGLPCVMTLHDFWTVCPRGQRMTKDLHLCTELDRDRCFTCLEGMWPHIFREKETQPTVVDPRGELSPQILAEYDRHMAYVLNLCDRLVAPSAFHRERMLEIPIDPDRIVSLPHGMDHAPFASLAKEPRPVKYIGYIGAVIPVKGAHVLIDAFHALGRPDLHLDIFGEMKPFHDDFDYEERIRAMAGENDNIHFHGEYMPEDVPRLLEEIDILVVPSLWWETFCLTIREGLLAGIPVVASDIGAMREALDGEQNGIFFRTGDSEDLREKLERLIDDDAYRAQFMNRGAAVKSLADYVEELEDVYADTVRTSRQRQESLVVARPFFPTADAPGLRASRIDLGTVPWDDIGVNISQHGGAGFSVQTRMPTGDSPSVGVGVRVSDGENELGHLEIQLDLTPLGDATPRDLEKVVIGQAPEPEDEPEPEPEATREAASEAALEEPERKGSRARKKTRRQRARASESERPSNGDRRRAEEKEGTDAQGVRTLAPSRPRPAKRHDVGAAPGRTVETVPQGGLPTERWKVRGPVKTRKVPVDGES